MCFPDGKLTMPYIFQLSTLRKCPPPVRHPNPTRPGTASHTHTHTRILILGSHSLLQLKGEVSASAPEGSIRKNASTLSPGAQDAHLLPPYLPCWLQAACSCHVIFSTLSTDGNLQSVMSCLASSQLTSTFQGSKK